MSKKRIAIPTMGSGGLKSSRSGHFGHCEVFTIVDIEQGEITNVEAVANVEHSEGGCLVPVNLLAGHQVDTIIVGGMGLRPLLGFKAVGINVLIGEGTTVGEAVEGFLSDRLEEMTEQYVCGGH